mgnify:CR=1 FL=1
MAKVISIGNQSFESMRERDNFYVDKTSFIKEWWENEDIVTLITRPRRFGKTLNMNMLECFFSNKYKDRGDLFEGLDIWKEEKYRKLQGTYPVIFLSFAGIKGNTFEMSKKQIGDKIVELYESNRFLLKSECISDTEKKRYISFLERPMDEDVSYKLNEMSNYLSRYYGKKVIILLDEYDTPMQEAYVSGYWEELVAFTRSLFNATFKTNPYLERAIMTGITRVSKESIFSDLNNLRVVTTTSDLYAECFGFTEKEVFASLDEFGMGDKKDVVKQWYDGFIFGGHRDIYNPWSITNYLKEKKLRPYWADTSSNGLAGKLIRTASPEIKEYMEDLLNGQAVTVNFDEQMVFEQLDYNENAIWSLLLASGYLKAEEVEYRGITLKPWYQLRITNLETVSMFDDMFSGWFEASEAGYSSFVKALMQGDLEAMNYYMNKVSLATFSHFDVGGENSESLEPERFYHGFVLGLMAERAECYQIRSNRESGFGRYDVMMIPKNREKDPAIIIEFKVCSRVKKETLEDAVQEALKQIVDKKYDAELVALGVPQERIRHYGFAFAGKNVLIGAE